MGAGLKRKGYENILYFINSFMCKVVATKIARTNL